MFSVLKNPVTIVNRVYLVDILYLAEYCSIEIDTAIQKCMRSHLEIHEFLTETEKNNQIIVEETGPE